MKVYLARRPGRIILMVRGEGPGIVGDLVEEIGPGESAFGKTYEEWVKLLDGEHEIP